MKFLQKLKIILLAIAFAAPSVAQAYTFNGNIDVRGQIVGGVSTQGTNNIAFAQGADSSQLKITSAKGAALSSTNPGWVVVRSSTNGTYRFLKVTADVTIDLTNAHWGLDTKGNVTGAILRVYAVDDNGTLRWGVGYQGGFYLIRNTQDNTTASNIDLPEEILSSSDVTTDNSPMRDVGYILANFTDSSNEWAISSYFPGESADGVWQPWTSTYVGFATPPSGGFKRWMQIKQTIFLYESTTTDSSIGTSGTYSMTLPVKAGQTTPTNIVTPTLHYSNNGSVITSAIGGVTYSSGSVTLTLRRLPDGSEGWGTAAGRRAALEAQYEAFQP